VLNITVSGTYSVVITDANGITGTDEVTVTVHSLPVVNLGSDIVAGSLVTLDAGAGFVSYLWSDGSTNRTLQVSQSGIYSVTVTNEWGCEGTDQINVTITGIENIDGYNVDIELYPNPSKGIFTLLINSDILSEMIIQLTDLQGKIVYNNDIDMTKTYQSNIDVSNLAEGIYYLKVITGDNLKVKKLIIAK
jgi:hypothetical protein